MSIVNCAVRLITTCACFAGQSAYAQDAVTSVAGIGPQGRAPTSPVMRLATVDAAMKGRRLQGVSTPWPGNLARIAEQGVWYSPMFQAGMPGRYDLRQLHGPRP